MQLVNLTPHPLTLFRLDGSTVTVSPSGTVARVSQTSDQVGTVNGVALVRSQFGEVIDLPAPQDGVIYIVSALVRGAVPDRGDLASPGDLVRNDQGAVVGCRSLIVS